MSAEKIFIVSAAAIVIALVVTVGSCSMKQMELCYETRNAAIKGGDTVLAASTSCDGMYRSR